MYPPVGSGTSSTVSFVVLFLASMGVVVLQTTTSYSSSDSNYIIQYHHYGSLLLEYYSTKTCKRKDSRQRNEHTWK